MTLLFAQIEQIPLLKLFSTDLPPFQSLRMSVSGKNDPLRTVEKVNEARTIDARRLVGWCPTPSPEVGCSQKLSRIAHERLRTERGGKRAKSGMIFCEECAKREFKRMNL